MGMGCSSSADWASYASSTKTKSTVGTHGVFSETTMKDEFNPKNITVRESMDSSDHPNSTPIILGLDVTGSMSKVLRSMFDNIGLFVENIYSRNIVPDPQICCMGIGDVKYDDCPLQVTQFESDIRIAEQMRGIYLEQGGGGNDTESYTLAWYFANNHVYSDAIEKRNKKGYIFTMGDECCPARLTKEDIKKVFGYDIQETDIPTGELLKEVSKNWNVYHLVITEGNFYSGRYRDHDGPRKISETWGEYLGQNVIYVTDMTKLSEIIISVLQVDNGASIEDVTNSWDGSTKIAVSNAISGLSKKKDTNTQDIVLF